MQDFSGVLEIYKEFQEFSGISKIFRSFNALSRIFSSLSNILRVSGIIRKYQKLCEYRRFQISGIFQDSLDKFKSLVRSLRNIQEFSGNFRNFKSF
jgi:hypothetical protein